ncbi:zinc ribbon domain-containing protein [Cytobacillus horneckiae]|uniref:zinc ribbon domain-containing protein n=1 Tax=Cytobacillus horneckiae TaxID=549687 RepID=UPI0034CEB859
MNAYSRKVKCSHCNKNMKYKRESGGKYTCSTYDNLGKEHCQRITVKEEFISSLIMRRYRKEMSDEELKSVVDCIIVEDELLLEIHFKNNDEPILLKGNFIQF